MSKEILDPSQQAQQFWGNTNLDTSDFAVPRVTIGQGTTPKDKGLPGHFNYNTGARVEELLGVKMIVPTKTRVLYGATNSSPARCKSDNSFQPSTFVEMPISDSCLNCFAAQWGENDEAKMALADQLKVKTEQRNKPLCAETYNILMADKDWQLFFISFQKTQLKIVQEKLFSRLKGLGVPPYDVAFDMKLQQITNPSGTYYSALFDNFQPIDDKAGAQIYGQWSKRAGEALSKQHEQMDREKVVASTDGDDFGFPTDEYPPDYIKDEGFPDEHR